MISLLEPNIWDKEGDKEQEVMQIENEQDTKALVFNIQRFSIHDGPGIRTLVFIKGCPLECIWCSNPEGIQSSNELMYVSQRCIGCGECKVSCPLNAITLNNEAKIEIDREKCNNCGICTSVCFSGALKMSAQEMTVEEVVAEVKKDLVFYKVSGGGITVSGGEPLCNPLFVSELLKACKDEGINTALETCGYVSSESLENVLKYVDYLLYDIKHIDSNKHEIFTGRPNEIILNNLKLAKNICSSVTVRIPFIPEFNDSVNEVLSIVEFASSLSIKDVHILPFHKLGSSKYKYLGKKYKMDFAESIQEDSEKLQSLKTIIKDKYNILVNIGG